MFFFSIAEPYADWLEQKIDLPIFEGLSSPEYGIGSSAFVSTGVTKPQLQPEPEPEPQNNETTRTLLQEFESVLGDVEACHQVTPVLALTPPQSPPTKFYEPTTAQILITLHPSFHTLGIPSAKPAPSFDEIPQTPEIVEPILQWGAENVSLEPLGDVASELAAVDEIVRSCVEDISPGSPPCTSSDASCVSFEDSTDDPEWMPEDTTDTVQRPAVNKSRHRKPYSRPSSDDRKVRKKEQNKNAATRYRQKKKQEVKEIVGEEQELANENENLKSKVCDLQREIRYLKGLMRDLFKAQGLLK